MVNSSDFISDRLDAEALYKSLKQHYQSILAPGDDQKAKQSDVLNNSVFHKTSLRTIKKVLEGIAEDAVLFSLDLHDKPVSAEGLTALLKAASEKNPKSSAHLFPISELILSKGQWTLADRRTSVDRKPASTEEENQNAQAERLFIQTLCDYLRETKTLAKLDLSSNKIGTEAVKTLAGSGIRYNDSLEFLGLANTGFDGSGQVADAFISALLELQDKRKLLPADNPLAHQENYNSSLRRLDLKSGEWKDDALQKFTALAFLTTRVTGLTLVYNEDRLETVRHEGKTLPYLLKRNGSIQGVLDDVMKSVMKRPFRQKLTNFRESVKNHRIKGKGGVDESGPVYKVTTAYITMILDLIMMISGLRKARQKVGTILTIRKSRHQASGRQVMRFRSDAVPKCRMSWPCAESLEKDLSLQPEM